MVVAQSERAREGQRLVDQGIARRLPLRDLVVRHRGAVIKLRQPFCEEVGIGLER